MEARLSLGNKMIKYLITDCDGVLTDGKYYYTADGKYIIPYHCDDSIAFRLARNSGLCCVMISSTTYPEIHIKRATELDIEFISSRPTGFKLATLSNRFNLDTIAYVGDTLDDIQMLDRAFVSFVPNSSLDEVKEHADYVLSRNGGEGCLLEVLLILRDKYGIDIRY